MTWWTLLPRDPLLVRDARPFSARASAARSMPFPLPSVVAGALRTRVGFALREPESRAFALTPAGARQIGVGGPLLCRVRQGGSVEPLFAAPQDAVLFSGAQHTGWSTFALAPSTSSSGDLSSLPQGLRPVEATRPMPVDKPARDAPAYWGADALRQWLAAPGAVRQLAPEQSAPPLPRERRVHVAIDPLTGTAKDGALFETDGLRFVHQVSHRAWSGSDHYRILVRCEHGGLNEGHQSVGGERRLSVIEPVELGASLGLPLPQVEGRRARVLLLTPGCFDAGAVPPSLQGATVVAAAVGRPTVVSGWDLAARGPKPTRRLAPAGSVYWVEIPKHLDASEWVSRVHLHEVSDAEQDRNDGFGLAAVGAWT